MLNSIDYMAAINAWTFSNELIGGLLLMMFAVLLIYETLQPSIKLPKKQLKQSYKTNIGMFVVNTIIMSALSASTLLLIVNPNMHLGVLHYIGHPIIKIILSFLLLDLFLYYWHKTCHTFDWLWRFHRVHHNDPYLNVSTAFRIHFVEIICTNILKIIFVIIAGIDEFILFINELITTAFVMFHHSNIKIKYESILSKIFISPVLHRTHHSVLRKEHDSNYGAIFSIWDRLFGTFSNANPTHIGLKGETPQDLIRLIKYGFEPVPNINTQLPIPQSVQHVSLTEMIQVAAYYKAEKRGFVPGHDQADWYEAQRDIINMIYNIPPVLKSHSNTRKSLKQITV